MTTTKAKHKTTGKIGLADFSISYETIPEQFKVSWEDGTISYEIRHTSTIL